VLFHRQVLDVADLARKNVLSDLSRPLVWPAVRPGVGSARHLVPRHLGSEYAKSSWGILCQQRFLERADHAGRALINVLGARKLRLLARTIGDVLTRVR